MTRTTGKQIINQLYMRMRNFTSAIDIKQWQAMLQRLYRAKAPKLVMTLSSTMFAGVILAFLLYRDRQALATFQWDLHWISLGTALLCIVMTMVWAALIWGRIMAVFGSRVTIAQHIRCYALSHLVKRLPGTIWYVASRGYMYQEYGEPLRLVTMASGIEFILLFVSGAFATLLLSIFVLPSTYQHAQSILLVVFLVGVLLIHPRTIRWLLHKFKMSDTPDLRQLVVLRWFLDYLLLWVLGGIMYFCLLNAFVRIESGHLLYIITSWCLVGTLSFFVFFCLRILASMKLA